MPRAESLVLTLSCMLAACASPGASAARSPGSATAASAAAEPACGAEPVTLAEVRPVVNRYCIGCHSPSGAAGPDYDFRGDPALVAHRRTVFGKLSQRTMPPPGYPEPKAAERSALLCWAGAQKAQN